MAEFGGLTDDVFEIHEEVFKEKSLFNLHILCDEVMNNNPTAKFDGVFKIRLSPSLKGSGSTLDDFWSKFNKNAPKSLCSLHLSCSEDCTGVMKFHSRRVLNHEGLQFKVAAKKPQTFDTSDRNCCMMALEKGGPRAALIHFYDSLLAKAIVIPNDQSTNNVSSSSNHYQERQSLLADDLLLTCQRIEKDMMDQKYLVNDAKPAEASVYKSQSHVFDVESINVEPDGDGDKCSLYYNGIEESAESFLYITPNFALSHLCHLNMLTDLPGYYAGISYPFVYLGGLHSMFPMHVEDMSLWSVNYNHFGHPKLIVVVAPSEVSRLSMLLTSYGLPGAGNNCIQKLFHKTDVVSPKWLLRHGFKFKVVIQHPGEFIVFAPNAAHTGRLDNEDRNIFAAKSFALCLRDSPLRVVQYFLASIEHKCSFPSGMEDLSSDPRNLCLYFFQFFTVFFNSSAYSGLGGNLGPNLAEACNFASKDWLPFGSVASQGRCECLEGVHFDVTQLIRDHRKDLLPYHQDRTLWTFFRDDHFQRSLLVPPGAYQSSTLPAASSLESVSCIQCQKAKSTRKAKPNMTCPVVACAKVYKTNCKAALLKHIKDRHPDEQRSNVVLQYMRDHFGSR